MYGGDVKSSRNNEGLEIGRDGHTEIVEITGEEIDNLVRHLLSGLLSESDALGTVGHSCVGIWP